MALAHFYFATLKHDMLVFCLYKKEEQMFIPGFGPFRFEHLQT